MVLYVKFCTKCGATLSDEAVFCDKCGNRALNEPASPMIAMDSSMSYVPDETIQDMFFKLNGRLNRMRYFKRYMVYIFTLTILIMILSNIFDDELITLISTASFYISYCLDVRRLQDLNKDATLARIILVFAIISNLVGLSADEYATDSELMGVLGLQTLLWLPILPIQLYLLFAEGTCGANRYGADPLEGKH